GRRQPSRKHRVVVDDVVREAAPLLEAVAGRSLGGMVAQHPKGGVARLDDTRLRQGLVNLVGNTADATRAHGSSIHVDTHLELLDEALAHKHAAQPGREYVVVTVADDGKGMDTRTVARIFDPFFTTKQDGRGTGLGLAITQSILAQADGFIEVESTPGEGT